MSKRSFEVSFEFDAMIELDDNVIDVVDDEWRSQLYDLHTPEDIAEHIAFNLVINNGKLSSLDGWADQPDDNAKLIDDGRLYMSIRARECLDAATDAG